MSRFDQLYRRLLLSKFFTKGWGKPENLKRIFEFRKVISNRETCKHLVEKDYPVHIEKDVTYSDCRIMEGYLISPFCRYLPGIAPVEVEKASFQVILPREWKHPRLKPVCLHLAGTGDHFYWRRRALMARPLLKEAGIASIILENPYYGSRKPKSQTRSSLHNVSDLFVMGGALVLESLALFNWCERQGWGPFGLTGVSMGGHMASLAATNWDKPISLVPCLSWSTASCAFTQGVLSGAIPWEVLQTQYFEDSVYEEEIRNLIYSPEALYKGAYPYGQQFVKDYPASMQNLDQVIEHYRQRGQEIILNGNANANGSHSYESTQGQSSLPTKIAMDAEKISNVTKSEQTNLKLSDPQTLQYATSKSRLSVPNWAANGLKLSRKKISKKSLTLESVEFMRGVMDECTHLGNFSIPVDPSLIIIVAAKQDAYIPRNGVLSLDKLWPGAEIRYIDSGHVAAFLLNMDVFRKAIIDSFDRQIKKYYS
ncbi:protein ABHD18 isoform X1 [Patella vulgata]|uniref:protein ABHD18 isoform X1 n=2 Tax=Patella vulgata TaxID=6465 RepID=UPI00217FF0B4|nr:protein ABHD18 isoform X1 [Patella vulgata]XP_050417668.1 protein ABHD18 isoform X1 [Patella vulgata]XP_050417670.1 protein ABHD18 isoform X1 [Patella vulgata]